VNDLLNLVERLLRSEVEFVLVGGQAALVYGVTLVTRDVDICLDLAPANLARLEAALADLHPVHRMTPQEIPFRLVDLDADAVRNLYLKTDQGVLDCLGEIAGVGGFAAVLERSVIVDLPIGRCRVLSLPALIAAKSALDRVQDKLALLQLRAIRDRTAPPRPDEN
jgi:hypothetical protein